jgi:tRNA A-37 threonylcarbamoyl transferase component Bud32
MEGYADVDKVYIRMYHRSYYDVNSERILGQRREAYRQLVASESPAEREARLIKRRGRYKENKDRKAGG